MATPIPTPEPRAQVREHGVVHQSVLFTIPMHQTMSSVHGPSIRPDGGNTITEKYARVVVTISKALSTYLVLDPYDCRRRRGGHRSGNRRRTTTPPRPVSSVGDIHLFVDRHDFMPLMLLLHLYHLVVWILLLWVELRLHLPFELDDHPSQ
jgi:hypothetical protein